MSIVQTHEFMTAARMAAVGTLVSVYSVTAVTSFVSDSPVRIEIGAPADGATLIAALIEKTAEVVGGSARIARTRIPVWTLEKFRRMGADDHVILRAFPTIRKVDLSAAWAYVALNHEDVDRDIAENDAA